MQIEKGREPSHISVPIIVLWLLLFLLFIQILFLFMNQLCTQNKSWTLGSTIHILSSYPFLAT